MPKNIPSPSLPDKGRKRIMRIIIEDPVLSLTDISFLEKGILALAHSFTKNGSRLYLSDEDLAVPLCTHRTTVNKAVQKLVKLGYLEKRTELREGGKSYRSLSSLIPEHSNILHLCSDEIDESIVANRYSHSSKTLQCSPTIVAKRYSHSSESLHIIKSNLKDINLKEVKEIVADAPTPTSEYSLTLEGTQDSEVLQESESLKELIEVSEAPPIPAAPPEKQKTKKRKEPSGRKVAFPSPEYWASVKPHLLTWMRDHGAQGTDEELLPWINERLQKLEGAALSKDMKYAAWDRTFMTWYRHLIPDKYKRGFDWFVRNAVDQTKFVEVWKKKKELEAFGYSDEGIEGYRKTLLNFDEDSPWGGNKIKHFRKTVQKGA